VQLSDSVTGGSWESSGQVNIQVKGANSTHLTLENGFEEGSLDQRRGLDSTNMDTTSIGHLAYLDEGSSVPAPRSDDERTGVVLINVGHHQSKLDVDSSILALLESLKVSDSELSAFNGTRNGLDHGGSFLSVLPATSAIVIIRISSSLTLGSSGSFFSSSLGALSSGIGALLRLDGSQTMNTASRSDVVELSREGDGNLTTLLDGVGGLEMNTTVSFSGLFSSSATHSEVLELPDSDFLTPNISLANEDGVSTSLKDLEAIATSGTGNFGHHDTPDLQLDLAILGKSTGDVLTLEDVLMSRTSQHHSPLGLSVKQDNSRVVVLNSVRESESEPTPGRDFHCVGPGEVKNR